jgi:hypothetical protein
MLLLSVVILLLPFFLALLFVLGSLSLVSLSTPDRIYMFDILVLKHSAFQEHSEIVSTFNNFVALFPVLRSRNISCGLQLHGAVNPNSDSGPGPSFYTNIPYVVFS